MSVNKGMTIGAIVESHPTAAQIFIRHGMACLDCPSTQFETLEQGALLHGLDVDELVKELNEAAAAE